MRKKLFEEAGVVSEDTYKEALQKALNFLHITRTSTLPDSDYILTTFCSKGKHEGVTEGTPSQIYDSPRLTKFYNACNLRPHGIISDEYGIVFHNEKVAMYDTPPSALKDGDFERLGQLIAKKCKKRGYDSICFVQSSILQALPYLLILSHSGLPIYFFTKIDNIRKTTQKSLL